MLESFRCLDSGFVTLLGCTGASTLGLLLLLVTVCTERIDDRDEGLGGGDLTVGCSSSSEVSVDGVVSL